MNTANSTFGNFMVFLLKESNIRLYRKFIDCYWFYTICEEREKKTWLALVDSICNRKTEKSYKINNNTSCIESQISFYFLQIYKSVNQFIYYTFTSACVERIRRNNGPPLNLCKHLLKMHKSIKISNFNTFEFDEMVQFIINRFDFHHQLRIIKSLIFLEAINELLSSSSSFFYTKCEFSIYYMNSIESMAWNNNVQNTRSKKLQKDRQNPTKIKHKEKRRCSVILCALQFHTSNSTI